MQLVAATQESSTKSSKMWPKTLSTGRQILRAWHLLKNGFLHQTDLLPLLMEQNIAENRTIHLPQTGC